MDGLPSTLMQRDLARIRQKVWDGGVVLVKIDRNPGRLVGFVPRTLDDVAEQNVFTK